MLAARSVVKRTAAVGPRLARSYAIPAPFTLADAAGVKIATAADGSPTGAIAVVLKAGSRFETAPGLAHVLKSAVFKGTDKRSAIRLVRETEMLGGVLAATLTREHLILSAEFLKGDEAYFAEVLGDAVTHAKFAAHEYNEEVVPTVATEYEQAIRDPTTYAFDLAHQIAFRSGLGNSLYASPHTAVDFNAATSFAKSAFSSPSNFAVLGSGIAADKLKGLVSDFFISGSSSSAGLTSPAASYFGGDIRVPAVGHHSALDHFLVGFKGDSSSSADFAVLRFLLGGDSSVKWSAGSSPLSKLNTGAATAKAFNLGYSDAGLFGVYIAGTSSEVQSLAAKSVEALKAIAKGAKEADVKQAIAKAKFAAADALESRVGKLEVIGGQIVSLGSAPSLEEVFAKLDKVTVDSVTKAAASALKSKPTTVAIGDTHKLPYADSIGL